MRNTAESSAGALSVFRATGPARCVASVFAAIAAGFAGSGLADPAAPAVATNTLNTDPAAPLGQAEPAPSTDDDARRATTAPLVVPDGYELLWADEFDADGPPSADRWGFEHGFVRNEEAQWYQPDNAVVENGLLVIEARRERVANPSYQPGAREWKRSREFAEYTSACIKTSGKFQFLYGIVEVRARIPIGRGMWPAIWTLGSAREWPGCGEIDIMEYYRGDILANAAWASTGRYQAIWDATKTPVAELAAEAGLTPEAWADRFHVWTMEWDENIVRLTLDGRVLNETRVDRAVNRTADRALPFREPHYLLLNLAIGGTNGGDPTGQPFPRRYEVDYVRVFQKPEDRARELPPMPQPRQRNQPRRDGSEQPARPSPAPATPQAPTGG